MALTKTAQAWDIAFVDLDLGVGREGGLAILDLLASQPSPPRCVLFTEAYDPGRTLCLVAAHQWFTVSGVMNKIATFTDDETIINDFVDLIAGVLTGRVNARWISPHCASEQVGTAFTTLLPTGLWYRKFQAISADASSAAAAEVLGLSENQLSKDTSNVADHIPALWTAIKNALVRGGRQESAVFQQQIDAYARDRDAGRRAYSVCHAFARGQDLFFMDPYVAQRAELPPRGFHHRGPIASYKRDPRVSRGIGYRR